MKFLFDIFISIIFIILFFWLFFIILILVKFDSKGPAIYWSKRVGKDNIIFLMPKFRTMMINTPQLATHLLKDGEKNITVIGKFLRRYSLDEIPQFYSVLIGKMSIVGPRPALYNQYDLINLRNKKNISSLLPGITGWAQINGRDEISIPEKVELECNYMIKKNFIFDVKIIIMTIFKVLIKKNITH